MCTLTFVFIFNTLYAILVGDGRSLYEILIFERVLERVWRKWPTSGLTDSSQWTIHQFIATNYLKDFS